MIRRLGEGEANQVVEWADAGDREGGCSEIDVPAGPVRQIGTSTTGLLAQVTILDTLIGRIAVKRPRTDPSLARWLSSGLLSRREVDFYLATEDVETHALPRILALSQELGLLVMEGVEPEFGLDQFQGLSIKDCQSVIESLGCLHLELRAVVDAPTIQAFESSPAWREIFADCEVALPRFLDEFSDLFAVESLQLLQDLPSKMDDIQGAARKLKASTTVCSMDMRADNVLAMSTYHFVFIDWQFAARAPGGFDLASLLSTSADLAPSQVRYMAFQYSRASKCGVDEVWAGFLLGLMVRAAFAVPVVMNLPHPDVRSRGLRVRAIERLGRLLNEFAEEIRSQYY